MNNKRGFVSSNIRNIDENEMVIEHVINTKTLDRYSTIVLPKGAEVKNFLNNPVVLWFHNVDNNPVKIPIGRCIELTVKEDAITAKTKFNENDPLSVKIFNAYKDGFLNAWSIGFQPLDYVEVTKENYKELNSKYKLALTTKQIKDSGGFGLWIFSKWELHEYSAVPVPANPDALNSTSDKAKYKKQLATRGLLTEDQASKVVEESKKYECECLECKHTLKSEKHCKDIKCPKCGGEMRRKDRPSKDEKSTEEETALDRVRKWASTDGSGDEDKIDLEQYKLAFAYYDEKDIKNLDSYKLLHCDIVDGKLTVIAEAVHNAICELDEGRSGTPEGELQAIHAHLTLHCAKDEPELETKAVPTHEPKEEKPEEKEETTEEKTEKATEEKPEEKPEEKEEKTEEKAEDNIEKATEEKTEEKPKDTTEEKTEEKDEDKPIEGKPKDENEAIAAENEEETDLEKEKAEPIEKKDEDNLDLTVTKETEEKPKDTTEEKTEEKDELPKGGYKLIIDDIKDPDEEKSKDTTEEKPEEKEETTEEKTEDTTKEESKETEIKQLTTQVKDLTILVEKLAGASHKRLKALEDNSQLDNVDVLRALDNEDNKSPKKTQVDVFPWGRFINKAKSI